MTMRRSAHRQQLRAEVEQQHRPRQRYKVGCELLLLPLQLLVLPLKPTCAIWALMGVMD